MAWFGRKSRSAPHEGDRTSAVRAFPTDGYMTPAECGDTYAERYAQLRAETLASDDVERSEQARRADQRVLRGPTQADRDHIPYVQEAWAWAKRSTRLVGLKRRKPPHGCVLDTLTRMRVTALVERRNLVWPETAAKVAGLDPARVQVEHGARREDVEIYLLQAQELVGEELEKGWDGVAWGAIDTDDPFRTIEIDSEACSGCGQCVVLCPEAFAKTVEGVVYVRDPNAVRNTEFEDCCVKALQQCDKGAIRLNTRGGKTVTGVVPPRGRPLSGERNPEPA